MLSSLNLTLKTQAPNIILYTLLYRRTISFRVINRIEYIYIVKWKESHDRPVDKDSVEDVQWIYENALERAKHFNIEGVTYSLTLGVIKNIIPAIASTNAIIAASTVMESIKMVTGCSTPLNNYFMYMGHEGLYSSTTVYEQNPSCRVCSVKVKEVKVKADEKLDEILKFLGLK